MEPIPPNFTFSKQKLMKRNILVFNKVRVQMQHKIGEDLGAFEMGVGANIGKELGGVKPLQ